jgi:hypothetical protein
MIPTILLDGAVRMFPGGREVCQPNRKGRALYRQRTIDMGRRQGMVCSICKDEKNLMSLAIGFAFSMTFQHDDTRGMGGARKDDRIVDENGNPINSAAHCFCNGRLGSRRL